MESMENVFFCVLITLNSQFGDLVLLGHFIQKIYTDSVPCTPKDPVLGAHSLTQGEQLAPFLLSCQFYFFPLFSLTQDREEA